MLNEKDFKSMLIGILIIGLFILGALILRPLIYSIIFALLLAYIFRPIYNAILKLMKNKTLSASVVCILLILIIVIPVALILSSLIRQAINVYLSIQTLDLTEAINQAMPHFIDETVVSESLVTAINSLIPKLIAYFITKFSDFIFNLPIILLHFFVIIFVFFFSLRDGDIAVKYIISLSPLSKEVETKFFTQFKDITNSVLLGQVVVGILQGIIAGIGYFVFGVPYAMFLTILTMIVGIIPLIGPWLVWVPVDVYLFASGRTGAGFGLLLYGLIIISWLDAIIRPIIVSKRTEISPAIAIIGMIGGMFVLGILGLIIGPLILGYVLLILEIYRKKKAGENVFLKRVEEEPILKI